LAIKYINTHLGPIKHSNIFDFYHNLTRDHITIKYTGKNLKVTRIPDIQIRVSGHNYDYVIKIMVKILI